jgi:hypothetical protein
VRLILLRAVGLPSYRGVELLIELAKTFSRGLTRDAEQPRQHELAANIEPMSSFASSSRRVSANMKLFW